MKQSTYFYLLRRGVIGGGGGLDIDYQAVLDYATSQGWDLPSTEQQRYQSTLLRTLKNIGVWDKLDRFFLHTTDSRNFARIDWVNPSSSLVAVNGDIGGTLQFTDNEGFHTDGVSYLNYRYNPTSDAVNVSQNSMTVGMYEWAVSSSNAGLLIGSDDASNDVVLTANFGGNAFLALNDDSTGFTPSITYKSGLYVGIRDGATSLRFYDADGTEYLDADPSTGLNSVDFAALKYGASSFSSTDVRAGLFFVGSEMVSEVSQLYTAVGDYYSSLNELLKPSNTIAPVISGTAERGETLTTTNGTWDNSPTAYSYQWQRDDVNISGATSSTYVLVADDDNTNITCVVSATNNYGTRTATSNTLGPVLGEPTILVAPVASGTPEVDQVLTTTDGTWQGLQPITITYQWRRDTVNISGATSNTYTLVSADLNALVDCQVTATNSIRSTSVDTNDLGPIEAAPVVPSVPVISGVPTISGTAKVGETLTATAASATGEPTPTTSWQWERSDNGTTGWASISGATSNTYTAVSADESKYLRVVQTETNTEGSDSANSAATAQVAAATDADYQAVLDRASTLGYTAPSSAQQTLQNTLVEDLKTAGVWSKLDVFYVFATDGDSDYATLNWKSPSNNQTTKVNSPTFTADSGFTGDGISSYLDINFQPVNGSQYAQDSAHFMIYSYGDDVGSTYYGGALDTTPSVIRSLNFGGRDNNNRFGAIAINSTGADVSSTNSVMTDVGFNLITRTSSTSVKAYKDNSLIGTFTRTSDTSSYQLARNIMLLARNLNGSANSYGTRKLAIVAIGSDVDSLASDYYTAINDYFTAL